MNKKTCCCTAGWSAAFWGRSAAGTGKFFDRCRYCRRSDTGRADKEAEKKITASTVPYSVAVLPYIDQSGMDEKGRKVAANAIKDALKEKYTPAKKRRREYSCQCQSCC